MCFPQILEFYLYFHVYLYILSQERQDQDNPMAKKTTEKAANRPVKDIVVDAALELAAAQGWGSVTFDEILTHAKVDEKEAQEYFDDKTDILVAYGRRVDRQMLDNCAFNEDVETSCREKLFDLIMERFDVLNEDRAALLSILDSMKGDPKQAVISLPHLGRSMEKMLDAVGIKNDGLCGAANVAGLTGLYLYVVKTWKEDDSPDMAKTMACLDKSLDRAESLFNVIENRDFLSTFSNLKDDVCTRFKREA